MRELHRRVMLMQKSLPSTAYFFPLLLLSLPPVPFGRTRVHERTASDGEEDKHHRYHPRNWRHYFGL